MEPEAFLPSIGFPNKHKLTSFKSLNFKYSWRKYQEVFLNHFQEHIKDNHLHVIAPPGSGKTLLGLEIVRRIGKRTIVLSPTLTIRNQWEERLQEFFTDKRYYEGASFDLNDLGDITFSTYQSLHALYKRSKDEKAFLDYFKSAGIKAVILDEAHHLKNEWWKCLFSLKQLQDLTIVALTATPPFDSSLAEIERYFELCGQVDDEIAVPNLVKEGDLCPHQDFIHFSLPEKLTIDHIVDFRMGVARMLENLKKDQQFIEHIKGHRFFTATLKNLDEIYKNPAVFSGHLIFLNSVGHHISKEKLRVLGFRGNNQIDYPKFNIEWAEVVLNHLFFDDIKNYGNNSYLLSLEKRLKRMGVLKTNRVDLIGSDTFYKVLASSPSKLRSIVEITKAAQKELNSDLRMVVLTDYIRKEFLYVNNDSTETVKMGAVPIFNNLIGEVGNISKIAVLTGSLVIVSVEVYNEIIERFGADAVSFTPMDKNDNFVYIHKIVRSIGVSLVESITQLFQEGSINILIGTKSLLGEGWDAPAINTLILASSVGSFVSSNQMRGRAIRTYDKMPNKTAVIWHLVCLDPMDEFGGADWVTLSRRFSAFMGISNDEPLRIENGVDRLDIHLPKTEEDIRFINSKSIENSKNTDLITAHWNSAIGTGSVISRELKKYYDGNTSYQRQNQLYFKDVVIASFIEIMLGLAFFIPELALKNINVILSGGWIKFIYILLSALVLGYGLKFYKAILLFVRHGNLHKEIYKMGMATLKTLQELGYIESTSKDIGLQVDLGPKGTVSCIPVGMTNYESTLFINTLGEIIAPIDNPRYLLQRKELFRNLLGFKRFYVVPRVLGEKKEKSEKFLYHWERNVGSSRLIYTRHIKGRKILLKARMFHISNNEGENIEKALIWH